MSIGAMASDRPTSPIYSGLCISYDSANLAAGLLPKLRMVGGTIAPFSDRLFSFFP